MTDQQRRESDPGEPMRARSRRRTELLQQRERVARARRERGLRLRPPSAQPLILLGSQRSRLRLPS